MPPFSIVFTLLLSTSNRLIGPTVLFSTLPKEPLLTLALDVPPSWEVEATSSVYDLDNIHLKSVSAPAVLATFTVNHLLVEGLYYTLFVCICVYIHIYIYIVRSML